LGEIEALVEALNGKVVEWAESRVALELNGRTAIFNRPIRNRTQKRAIDAVRQFLRNAGMKP